MEIYMRVSEFTMKPQVTMVVWIPSHGPPGRPWLGWFTGFLPWIGNLHLHRIVYVDHIIKYVFIMCIYIYIYTQYKGLYIHSDDYLRTRCVQYNMYIHICACASCVWPNSWHKVRSDVIAFLDAGLRVVLQKYEGPSHTWAGRNCLFGTEFEGRNWKVKVS